MAKRDLTNYQRKIVNRYYEHRDTIALTRLGDLVTDLYLADTEKKRDTLWKRVETALRSAGATPQQIDKVMADRDPAALAQLIQTLQ